MTEPGTGGNGNAQDLPVDQLKDAARALAQALMVRALEKASGQIGSLTERLDGGDGAGVAGKAAATGAKKLAEGESPLKAGLSAGATGAKEMVKDKVKSAVGGGGKDGKGGGGGKMKVTNIMEEFDVGLPRRVAYDQWTQFADYPSFTKKVESVEQESDEKINWRAQVFLSHRTWESTIIEQVPDERIVWKSKGPKGYVDGAVTFHELAPSMTRVLLVAEYHPDGFFEKTANMWRAQGRRLRLDFKHIKRHMMTKTLLEQEEVEGWRGEIRDGEVVKTHEDALKEEEQAEEAKSEAQAEGEEKKPDERAEEPKAEQEDEKEKPEAEQKEKEAESARA
ncbi:SRPBCC family protein [Actinomadura luteofluorescens]|uniref:SRPBCC family protein n=1 Tax=Actinomadura luteofluorescens TaxID=46163 RepID=UPI0030CB8BF7